MNAGYVRLSRDDDKRNYVSIENQKLIISQYAAEKGVVIDRWYEDDGVSGYIFDRPGFRQLMADLEQDIDTVFVKDFSRLGRHNAKVLLLLDNFQEHGKHLIVIDDNYDSQASSDDTIGIKTWFNERYVKDTSKKIKRAIGARQKEGTLRTQPPFGYQRSGTDQVALEIVPSEAEYVKMIYELYISGSGYRKIANHLNSRNIPTPSLSRHEHEIKEGRVTKRGIARTWTDSMVKDILDNDFYMGILRLKKRSRSTVHGKDKRVPKEEQYIFKDHHPVIIDKNTFSLVQDMKKKRSQSNYRGNRSKQIETEIPNPFGTCLFCKNCGSRLTPIKRQASGQTRKYYICTTYNTKGKRYCAKSHLVYEDALMEDVLAYIKFCRDVLSEAIAAYNMKDFVTVQKSLEEKRQELQNSIDEKKNQLKVLFKQKITDLSNSAGNEDLINNAYESLQNDLLANIHSLETHLKELDGTFQKTPAIKNIFENPLKAMDQMISNGNLDRRDIELLIQRIEVDENGLPEITFRYGLSDLINHSPAGKINFRENTIIATVMKLIIQDTRGYTSAKYLSQHLAELGFQMTKHRILPYLGLMGEMGILRPTENPLKPFDIVKSRKEIELLLQSLFPCLPAEIAALPPASGCL